MFPKRCVYKMATLCQPESRVAVWRGAPATLTKQEEEQDVNSCCAAPGRCGARLSLQ